MERTFHSPLGNRSPFSPRSRQTVGAKSALVPPAFRKSSRFSVSGKSTQSVQIILKSPYNYIERFGQSLPVLITEALTFVDRNAVVTARISECGFAWVVCGRRLLVWQYRQSIVQPGTPLRKPTINNQCFELQLPQSDLAHRAELVSVFLPGGVHTPSCIAVSPEGVVRYWPVVTHEGISVEQIVDLQGQECDSLTDIGGLGCILATTTCSVVLVCPQLSAGRHSLSCRMLRTPTGWLGGISKRMSSLIFGPISSEQSAETRLVRVLTVKESDNAWIVYVLAGHSLQKWRMSETEPEQLVFVLELNRLIRDHFHATVWENCGGDQTETDTWLLDIQSDKDSVIILAAAVNMHVSPQVHYAMVSVPTNSLQAPENIRDFFILKMSGLYKEDNPADSLAYRFLLCGTCAYLYNQRSITVIKPQEEPDTLEFNGPQDFLLGGSICVNTPVFFSRNHGLVAVSSNELAPDFNSSIMSVTTPLELSMNDTAATGNLTLYHLDPEELCNAYKDVVGQLKAAFIFHIKNQQQACQDILRKIFVSEGVAIPGIDAVLDKVVVTVCKDLVDDIPAGDPRWSRDTCIGLGSSHSMQVLHQLEDKQAAHGLYVRFLRESELWNRLAAVNIRGTVLATAHVLGEFSEKILASIVLKSSDMKEIFESAINDVIKDDEIEPEYGLTKQDVFYREVSTVQRVLQELVNKCDEIAHSDRNPAEVAEFIAETNDLLLTVLKEVTQYRYQNKDYFNISTSMSDHFIPEYLPWTAAAGVEGLSDALIQQQSLTYNYGAKITSDNNLRNTLYDQLVNLTDLILDGRRSHLESVQDRNREDVLLKQYHSDRCKLINPLVTEREWERAALLAEKYLDFETLMVICESTENQYRLNEYIDRFDAEDFSNYVFTWYLQHNKPYNLINLCKTKQKPRTMQKLNTFLSDHPTLSWIQNILDKKFADASVALKKMAFKENESITRQKTMFSLSKLSKLAAPASVDSDSYIDQIDSRLELIAFQEDVPDYVLERYGYDTTKPCVIPPKDLIHLYTCVEYTEATEVEFKKALDLLVYVDDDSELQNTLALKIWRRAVLRDSWLQGNIDSPIEILQNTLFFKLTDLALVLGADPHNLLPPLDSLTEDPEFAELQENKNFQYLIKTGYEHVYRSQFLE